MYGSCPNPPPSHFPERPQVLDSYASLIPTVPSLRWSRVADHIRALFKPSSLLTTRCSSSLILLGAQSPTLPGEDVYEVSLELFDAGENSGGQVTHDVTVQNWLIISLGDSVASGEGTMRNQNGNSCDQAIPEEGGAVPFLGISAAESQWASTDMMVRLNQQVAAGAGRNGWSTSAASLTHSVRMVTARTVAGSRSSRSPWQTSATSTARFTRTKRATPSTPGG